MEESVVVLDYGSHTIKAGYALSFPSDSEPRIVKPSLVEIGSTGAASQPPTAKQTAVVSQGRIQEHDQFEAILHQILYQDLAWQQGTEGSIVVAEPLFTSRHDRELIAQLLFEVFNVSGMYVQDQAVLSLYSLGRTSGLVVDIGHGKCDIGTVTEGLLNSSSTRRIPTAGAALTSLLQQQLCSHHLSTQNAQHLKEQCASACESSEEYDVLAAAASHTQPTHNTSSAAHPDTGASTSANQNSASHPSATSPTPPHTYILPDGHAIDVSPSIAASLGEALFRPTPSQQHTPDSGYGVAYAACDAVSSLGDFASRRACFDGIVLCGGSSLIKGVAARFLRDLRTLAPPSTSPAYVPVPDYLQAEHTARYASWIGGSVIAKVLAQQNQYVTKADYEEHGPAAVRRCT
ncbi:MAG: hypothetical protein WDW36_006764 [Sanguina aurantia]